MRAVNFILAIVFATLLAFIIFEDVMLMRALWSIPIILMFQINSLLNKLEAQKQIKLQKKEEIPKEIKP